ncbi:hypothetical protein BpHYR1_049622 [Brachionus plicatilis]|uniref:Uncharacterized protein n=1 Tax=Brachionus plicatilis TaxID=10195 RepID=A0A3M7T300_BRAPC|nr:hypothetical protein BpHYR1_049622 [Brachionus plicatilis]
MTFYALKTFQKKVQIEIKVMFELATKHFNPGIINLIKIFFNCLNSLNTVNEDEDADSLEDVKEPKEVEIYLIKLIIWNRSNHHDYLIKFNLKNDCFFLKDKLHKYSSIVYYLTLVKLITGVSMLHFFVGVKVKFRLYFWKISHIQSCILAILLRSSRRVHGVFTRLKTTRVLTVKAYMC